MVNFREKLNERPKALTRPVWQRMSRTAMLLAMLMLYSATSLAAVIKGYVKDESGEPVIGATVIQKDKQSNGTATDIDGMFELNVSGNSATLVVKSIGFQDQTVKATAGKVVYVTLSEDAAVKLDDVVVVAYGTQKKATVTGSVATVDNRDIKKSSAARLDNALAGRVTGLVSFQNGGGQPGVDGATMFLRGVSSNVNQSPLILVDGVERDVIGQLDPNEVENVSVLKDASATAVFGVRGANGVILITTRRGHSGKPDLSVSFEQSWTSFTKRDSRVHNIQWMRLRNEALVNGGNEPAYTDDIIYKFENPYWGLDPNAADYEQMKAWRDYMYPDHYWVKELFRDYTMQSKANINMAGGTEKFKYFINVGFIHQGGNMKNEKGNPRGYDPSVKSDQWKFRSNLDYDINKYFKASLNLSTYIRENNQPNGAIYERAAYDNPLGSAVADLFYQATILPPIYAGPLTMKPMNPANETESGLVVDPQNMDRGPYEVMNRFGYYHGTTVQLQTNLSLEYDLSKVLTPGLKIRGSISYDAEGLRKRSSDLKEPRYSINQDFINGNFDYALNGDLTKTYSLASSSTSDYKINAQAQVSYNRQFGKHDVGGMFLAQRDYSVPDDARPHNVVGMCFRLTYGFDSRYLAEVDFGYNGSEQFAPKNRFGSFPAASLGWIISNEKFMQGAKKWLDNLKIRGSYGRVGSDGYTSDTSKRFLYLDNIYYNGISDPRVKTGGGLGTGDTRILYIIRYANPDQKWETADKFDIGIDLGFLRSITLTVDYFREKRRDILVPRQSIPAYQGTMISVIPSKNMGKIDNYGWEFELGYNKNLTQDLSLNAKINWGYNHNKVLEWDEPERDPLTYVYPKRQEGFPLNQCWGYKIDYSTNKGFFVPEDFDMEGNLVSGYPSYEGTKPRPGDFKYIDLNHDGAINDKDLAPIKNSSIPGISYGFSLGLNYKDIDFAVFFAGLGKFSKYYNGGNVWENVRGGCYYEYQRTAWTAERWANGEKITYPALTTTASSSLRPNDYFIMDRSYTRLKNIIIGYTLPRHWLKSIGVKSCRIYASAENLFVWDNLKMKHLDPEQSSPTGYPITKNMTVGINVNF